MTSGEGSRFATVATFLCLGMIALLSWGGGAQQDALVVYCSHDSTYSEEILRDFEREFGIRLIIRFDTEATKSIGLMNLLKLKVGMGCTIQHVVVALSMSPWTKGECNQ